MIDLEAELAHLLPLVTLTDGLREVVWRGFRFYEGYPLGDSVVCTRAELVDGSYYYVTSIRDSRNDRAWLKGAIRFVVEYAWLERDFTAYDGVPWEIHTIDDLSIYLTALRSYNYGRH